MSEVKFEKESVRATTGGKEDFVHRIGEAITKSSGPDGYLAVSVNVLCHYSASSCVNEAQGMQESRS